MSKVLVIGASMIDVMGKSEENIILEDSNPGHLTIRAGGVGHNICVNLVHLKCDVTFITTLSSDVLSESLRSSLAGVNLKHIHSTDLPSSTYLGILEPSGDLLVSLSDTTALDSITPEFLHEKRQLIDDFDLIIVDASLHKRHFEVLLANHPDKKFYLEPVSIGKAKHVQDLIGQFFCIKCNEREAAFLIDEKLEKDDDFKVAANKFHELGVKKVIITRGSLGGFYSDSLESFFYESVPSEVRNVTGAGDGFMAGFMYGEINKLNTKESIDIARHMAGLTLETIESVNPLITIELIKERINETRKSDRL